MEGGGTPYSSGMAPSGSYILVIVSQPVTEEHKQVILQRLNKGLLSWDVQSTGCDLSGLESVCSSIGDKHLSDNDVLIQHSTESLGVEILVSPTVSTLKQCIKNLFSTSTGHKQLIHAGYTFAGSGSWILQNGTFSFDEFLDIFQQADVQSQKRCNINVHCSEVGPWNSTNFAKDIFTNVANIALNPAAKVDHVPGSQYLIDCLNRVLNSQALEEMMEASPLVGNIRFNRPTLYMFPAGQGDCALFGINGFNMLVDGGFNRKPCSWEFIRHLDRLDAVLVTRLCENNLCGMATLMKRKALNNTYPQIGYVFCNIAEGKVTSKEDAPTQEDDLIVSVVGEGHNFVQTLNDLKLKPHQCWRDSSVEPFVLYHKVGHGTLEMHVLSPPRDSKEMKEFLTEWNAYKETFSCIKSGLKGKSIESTIPLSHATSICAVLVWRPADPKDTITRILFPGSAPQNKIFESLEKLKALDILNQPVVTKASLTTILVSKPISNKVEKTISRASIPNRKNTSSPALSVSSIASRNGDIGGVKKEIKDTKKISKEVKKDNKEVKKEVKKEIKKEFVMKEVKRDIKTESVQKKEGLIKKELVKEVKKDNKEVKKVIKKDNKDVKVVTDKKADVKSAPKKVETTATVSKTVSEVKKTATTVRKSTTPVKKDVGKPPVTPKSAEAKKPTTSKVSEPKAAKDVNNKKAAEAKTVPKTKPKSATTAAKSTPKTKPVAVAKPGSKMTKAVAASSIVASAVAVTAAAVELNEKKDEVVEDVEPEAVSEKELEINTEEQKEVAAVEKSEEEINVSPLPPEALSPTPSESVSLTPSDTLSSAPLETVSPTPPLANEPISSEEKEVNEIKDIEPDNLPYEIEEPADESGIVDDKELEKTTDEVNAIEVELAKQQEGSDVMSTSFIGGKDFGSDEIEEIVSQTQAAPTLESAPPNVTHLEDKENDENIGNEKDVNEEIEKYEEYLKRNETEIKEINVDDQLQGLSMEGSFCTSVVSSNEKEISVLSKDQEIHEAEIETSVDEVQNDLTTAEIHSEPSHKEQAFGDHVEYERELISQDQYNEQSLMPESEIINSEDNLHDSFKEVAEADKLQEQTESFTEIKHEVYESEMEENISQPQAPLDIPEEMKEIGAEVSGIDTKDSDEKVDYEKDFDDSKFQENYESLDKQDRTDEMLTERRDPHVERLSQIQSMEESFHEEAFENFEHSSNIIDDVEMQESSVDEPEEIVRKESAVSITLNDEEPESNYADSSRRKSGTESEDDVDIQRYMAKEADTPVDQEKLHVKHESESDDEDVVKSPTPHAVVDYEGHVEEAVRGVENRDDEEFEIIHDEKEVYPSEKQDFDEKDRDSAEEQEDTDDGEMIRHPTPPNMKYSEEEMRDPIGQHYITAPGLKAQGSGITEQPLYEETEDYGSERSVSPVVEQPVFGSAVEADFPELVTVSGGTTPSEPQSPKANFETKKFISESGVMEALSEHDISESSAHSPSCQDGSTTFDLQAEKNVLETESLHYIPHDEQMPEVKVETLPASINDIPAHEDIPETEVTEAYSIDVTGDKELESKLGIPTGEKQDALSDDESCSHNEKSEPQSEDKSDVIGDDRSDIQGDDRSDMHGDDRSDIHGDDKSDVQGDDHSDTHGDDRSDIHGDDRSDIQGDDRSDVHADDRSDRDDRSDVQGEDRFDIHGEYRSDIHDDKSDIHGDDCSDIHVDDKSDFHGDDHSDIHVEDKSDFHRDDHSDIHVNDKSDIHRDDRSDIHDDKSDIQGEDHSDIHEDRHDFHDNKPDVHNDRSDIYPDKSDHQYHDKPNVLHDDQVQDKFDKYVEEQYVEKSNITDTKASFHDQHELNIQENESDYHSEIQASYEVEQQYSDKIDQDYNKSEVQQETKSDVEEDCGLNIQGEVQVQMANQTDIYDSSNILGHQIDGDEAFVTDTHTAEVHDVNYGYQEHKSSGVEASEINTEKHIFDNGEQLNDEKSIANKDSTQNATVELFDVSSCSAMGYNDVLSNVLLKGEEHSQTNLPAPDTYVCNSHNYNVDEIETGDSNISSFSQEVPQGEDKLGKLSIEQSEIYRDQVELHEVISPQHAENYSVIENKVFTEVKEAHQYEVLSQYEENTHTSNEVYSESSLMKNILSDENLHEAEVSSENINNANWQHVSNEVVSHTTTDTYGVTHTTSSYEYSTISGSGDIEDMNKSTRQKDIDEKIFNDETLGTDNSSFAGFSRIGNEASAFGLSEAAISHETLKELASCPDAEREYSHDDSKFMQTYTEKSFPDERATDHHQQIVETVQEITTHSNGFDSAVPQINFKSTVHEGLNSVSETPFGMINGKDQSAFSVTSAEFTQHHFSETNSSHTEVYTTSSTEKVEQESSYIINSRFHSDSPEDNVMRNDSSPEVPYPAESTGQFPDLKNSVTSESHQDSYLQNKDDFKGNLNFPNAGGIPLSPNNQTRNANREIPYGESSEDEDSSSLPGTVSPYAYTNKAYAREEEDIDGNHIYKEQSTEVIKQVEFDGNNPQTMTTHQMSSMSYSQGYQEMQYSGETNYDFHVEEWGKPMGLPTPPDNTTKTVAKKTDKPATKSLSRTAGDASNGKAYSPTASTKLSSPLKKPKPKAAKESSSSPVYVDLAYVPHHGDPQYCDVEFFKKIRARYYVFSSINPSKEVLNALLEAKKTWNEDLDVTIIPTYETDTLGYWMAQNQDDLATYSIEVAPSASRCTVNLQDHETSCAAYRLEF